MNLTTQITDNITELLVKILEFTEHRQKVLTENINKMSIAGYEPRDIDVDGFSEIMNNAIAEHINSKRLVLYDNETISFGMAGSLKIKTVPDLYAKELLGSNPDEYLKLQIEKLMENTLNQKVAAELLKQKKTVESHQD